MMTRLLYLGLALALLGCGGDDDSTSDNTDTPTSSDATSQAADMGNDEADTGSSDLDCGTTHVVTTTDDTADFEAYMDFAPEALTIAAGDCVTFEMSATHNAVEVSEETYNNRMIQALEGGFNVTFGATGTVKFDEPGIHYYVCVPHVRGDMVGTITVE
ncbi:MAG: hypothetical protein CMH52_14295 [Myxococcales bacterium]|nr:hypothetical protein [Myxococcales bacterium]